LAAKAISKKINKDNLIKIYERAKFHDESICEYLKALCKHFIKGYPKIKTFVEKKWIKTLKSHYRKKGPDRKFYKEYKKKARELRLDKLGECNKKLYREGVKELYQNSKWSSK